MIPHIAQYYRKLYCFKNKFTTTKKRKKKKDNPHVSQLCNTICELIPQTLKVQWIHMHMRSSILQMIFKGLGVCIIYGLVEDRLQCKFVLWFYMRDVSLHDRHQIIKRSNGFGYHLLEGIPKITSRSLHLLQSGQLLVIGRAFSEKHVIASYIYKTTQLEQRMHVTDMKKKKKTHSLSKESPQREILL